MPIFLIPYLLVALISGGIVYTYEHAQTKLCEATIDRANSEAKNVLSNETARVAAVEREQRINAERIETDYAKAVEFVRADNTSLIAAQRVWASHQTRSTCPLPKAGNTGAGKKADGAGYYLSTDELSTELEKIIPTALLADRVDTDMHYTLTWLRSLPPELIKQ